MAPEVLAWTAVTGFLIASISGRRLPTTARRIATISWGTLAGFLTLHIPVFANGLHSPVETIGATIAVPACLIIAYRLHASDSTGLLTMTRAAAVAGVLYLVAASLQPVRATLIETVAAQTHAMLTLAGVEHALVVHPGQGLRAQFEFSTAGHTYTTHLVFACTGAAALAALTGLIAVIDRPIRTRITTLVGVAAFIWGINLVRNAFIAVAFGHQWFQYGIDPILTITGYRDPHLVSYVVADRLIAQPLAVIVLGGVLLVLGSQFPSLQMTVADLGTALRDPRNTDPSREVDP